MDISCQIPLDGPISRILSYARLAESLGFESVNCGHIASRDSFTTLTAVASHTDSIAIATSVVPIYTRTPASMAQTAATVDDISGGRFRLGLGVGHRVTMGEWHGQEIGNPTAEMREYVAIVKAVLAGEPPPPGERWSSSFALMGFQSRPDLPIHLAGLSPAMLRLAGEIADGVILWSTPPDYIRDVVVPEIAAGRGRAGKSLDGFEITAVVATDLSGDRDAALDGARNGLHRYFGLPFYRKMFASAGYAAELAAYDAVATDREAQKATISESFIDGLCILGDDHALERGIALYAATGVTNLQLATVPGGDLEPTLRAAGSTLAAARATAS